jgi:formylglycine-generating enzyme required for sulfatase activity
MKDYYAVLDLKAGATSDEIRDQYRFLMQAWHPDKFSNPAQKAKASEKAKEINEAYAVLSELAKHGDSERVAREQKEAETRRQDEQRRREAERVAREQADARVRSSHNMANVAGLVLKHGITIEFVRVPAGEFVMGSTDADTQAYDNEKPQSKINLAEYWIGKYDVTNAQFRAFVQATGYKTTAETAGSAYAYDGSSWNFTPGANWQHPRGTDSTLSGKDNHPVVNVSWDDAVAFSKWASRVTGKKIALPTEAQWEKAARGTDGRIYPWGDQVPDATRLNFNNNIGDTTEVGKYSPAGDSPYGAVDMAGNVWQWMADWCHENYYATSPVSNSPYAAKRTGCN